MLRRAVVPFARKLHTTVARRAHEPAIPRNKYLEKFMNRFFADKPEYHKPGYPLSHMPIKSYSKWKTYWLGVAYISSFMWLGFWPWHMFMLRSLPYQEMRHKEEE